MYEVVDIQKLQKYEKNEKDEKILNQYKFIKKIGEGQYGKVYLAKKLAENQYFAIKKYNKNFLKRQREVFVNEQGKLYQTNAYQDVEREILIMKKINHPYIIRLHEIINDPCDDKLFMILEYAENGQMIEWNEEKNEFKLKHQDFKYHQNEQFIKKMIRDLLKALSYLHNNGIIHYDIKPQNIVFDKKYNVKLCDFGVSQFYDQSETKQINKVQGTYYFMAPELFSDQQFSKFPTDIWSLGVSIYCFYFLQLPFFSQDYNQLKQQIIQQQVNFPQDIPISDGFKQFFYDILNKNNLQRITIPQLAKDKWLNEGFQNNLFDTIQQQEIIRIQQLEKTDIEITENEQQFFSLDTINQLNQIKTLEHIENI